MATLQLTSSEVAEIRQLIGSQITTDDLPDTFITSSAILGVASNYVFEHVREGLNIDMLPPDEREIAERFHDETDDDIAAFINQVLKPPQNEEIRRAVMYRCAGCAVVSIQQSTEEDIISVRRALGNVASDAASWMAKRDHFWRLADLEIESLRRAFPNDAFSVPIEINTLII